MAGALMTHQQPLQQIIGIYYIVQDFVLISQYVYYSRIYPNRGRWIFLLCCNFIF